MSKKLLWFGDIGRPTSFSRISEAILPNLLNDFKCFMVAPPKGIINTESWMDQIEMIHVGEDIPSINLSWDIFLEHVKKYGNADEPELSLNMKYTLFQTFNLCREKKIDYLMFVIGIYEADWFMGLYEGFKHFSPDTKIVVWTPFDYIPTFPVIENIIKGDYVFTMTPTISNKIKELSPSTQVITVPHGVSTTFYPIERQISLNFLNTEYPTIGLGLDDIVILNANSYVSRKQIELTIQSFLDYCISPFIYNGPKKYRLWLHTNIQNENFKKMFQKTILPYVGYFKNKKDLDDLFILTPNNVKDSVLNNIYNYCQLGLQTSWGEGWSLTNCEHASVGGIQIVPNFLATGLHFSDKGIVYEVDQVTSKNEANKDIVIAKINIPNVVKAINDGVDLLSKNRDKELYTHKIKEYLDQYSWKKIANQIKDIFYNYNKQE